MIKKFKEPGPTNNNFPRRETKLSYDQLTDLYNDKYLKKTYLPQIQLTKKINNFIKIKFVKITSSSWTY